MLRLPKVEQSESFDCGRAAVLCVCRLFGVAADVSALATDPHTGTHPSSVETFLRSVGLSVQSGSMTVADLIYHTGQGRPVLCLVTFGLEGHYVVVGGVTDGPRAMVHYLDPAKGRMCNKSKRGFLTRWWDHDWAANHYDQWGIATWQ